MIAPISEALNNRKIFYDVDKSDICEYQGLREFLWEMGFKSFIYRYKSLIEKLLKKIILANYT
jgi:hypothetical protein